MSATVFGQEQQILIQCGAIRKPVTALVYGRFAVNTYIGDPIKSVPTDSWFTITHVATGRMVAELPGRANAIRLARALENAHAPGVDMTEADFNTAEYREWALKLRNIIVPVLKRLDILQ